MITTSRQKLKLLYLYKMLDDLTDAEHGLTMAQILERLEELGISAERKGIYNDIKVLKEFGCEIKTIQHMPVEYTMEKAGLTLEELTLLVDAVQSCRFLTQRTAQRLIKKLSALASVHERETLTGRVHVDGRVKSQMDSVFYNVDTLHEAMRLKKKVSFLYFKYNSQMKTAVQHAGKPYILTPVHIVFANNYYYLIAWSDAHEDFVRFRVDRMRLLQISTEKATRNQQIANYAFEDFAYQSFGMYDGEPTTATLRVASDAMDIVVDRFGTDISVHPHKDGDAELNVLVRKSAQFFGWIAGMNGAVTIDGPQKLAEEYRLWLQKLAAQV